MSDETKFELSGMKFGDDDTPEVKTPASEGGDPAPNADNENKTEEEIAAEAAEQAKLEAETKTGDDAVKNNDNGEEDSSKTESGSKEEDKPEGSEEDKPKEFNELLVEQSGGTFKSMEEVNLEIKRLTENQRTEQDDLDSDLYNKFKDFRKGRTGDANSIFTEFLSTQVQNFAEMDGDALLRYKMRIEYPSISETDIEVLMDDNYKSNEEEYTEKQVSLGKIRKEKDILNARKELSEMQSKTALSEPASKASNEEQELQIKEQNEAWDQSITDSMKDFKQVDIVIDDKGGKFSFQVDNNKEISDAMYKPSEFFQRYVDKDGKVDMEGFRNAITILTNLDKVATALSINGTSLANEKHLEDRTNPSKKDVGGDGAQAKEKSHTVGLGEAMIASRN